MRTNAGITTTQDNSNIVLFSVGYDAPGIAEPPGMTVRSDWDGNDYVMDETIATAGATGARNSTHVQGGYAAANLFITAMIEVKGSVQ